MLKLPVMILIRELFYTLPRNIVRVFWRRNLKWHAVAAIITLLLVTTGTDWRYFEAMRPVSGYFWPAVRLGWFVPMIFPVALYMAGWLVMDRRVVCAAISMAQSVIIGLFVTSFYKAFTGRPGPGHSLMPLMERSREFRFGFLRGGVFWGWPSSHTTIAFAMSMAIWSFYPGNKAVRAAALVYAFYIGIGVSMTIHWFSDFVAGAIIGTVIGTTVAGSFKKHLAG
ncbi:MAG: phosphatase PAP2 family protein [Actinomycetota bacterium]|nr:phosphatase PAP2 family protein [Actinomycetota bacterium]